MKTTKNTKNKNEKTGPLPADQLQRVRAAIQATWQAIGSDAVEACGGDCSLADQVEFCLDADRLEMYAFRRPVVRPLTVATARDADEAQILTALAALRALTFAQQIKIAKEALR